MVWLGLAGPVIDALANGNVLLVDEIEASLHPALVYATGAAVPGPRVQPQGRAAHLQLA